MILYRPDASQMPMVLPPLDGRPVAFRTTGFVFGLVRATASAYVG